MIASISADVGSHLESRDNSFDIYIFTLHWPYTTCFDWKEKRHGQCARIESPSWSVHGMWPTRMGEIAPNFCNNSWSYSHQEMLPLMSEMERFWPDVEIRDVTDSLWSHEWVKHGTCAVQDSVTGLHSQTDYFTTGLKLAAENPLTHWLSAANIVPSDDTLYSTQQFWDVIVSATGHRPHIDCEKVDQVAVIKEIKVCYDKTLSRVDCDGIKSSHHGLDSHMMGTCLRYSSFLYPASSSPDTSLRLSGSSSVVAVVCAVLAAAAVIIGAGYFLMKKYSSRRRGYESL